MLHCIALHTYPTAVATSNRLGNRQSQARPPLAAGAGWIQAGKTIKNAFPLGRWNTWAAVMDGELDLPAPLLQAYFDSAAYRTVLNRVADQVDQQTAQFRLVAQHPGRGHPAVLLQAYLGCGSRLAALLQHVGADFGQVAHLLLALGKGSLQVGQQEQVSDQLLEAPALAQDPIQARRCSARG